MRAKLLVIPGGRDTPYQKMLKGKANDNIRKFVFKGGSYLGICAGAYYACASFEFDAGGPLEIIEKRDLGFFPGTAIGPIYAPYVYESEEGAKVVSIETDSATFPIYYNGGGYFESPKVYPHTKILAHYKEKKLPAIIEIEYGKGRVILSGVHFEYFSEHLTEGHPLKEKLKIKEDIRRTYFEKLIKKLGT